MTFSSAVDLTVRAIESEQSPVGCMHAMHWNGAILQHKYKYTKVEVTRIYTRT